MPSISREDDIVCFFQDRRIPFIMRGEKAYNVWIGEAYMHGIMFGEPLGTAEPTDVEIFQVK